MTLDFYRLREQPFGLTPDTRFLYMSTAHREALSSLFQSLQAGSGMVTLLAPPGLGKTTLLYQMLKSLQGSVSSVYIFQAPKTQVELVHAILADLGVIEVDKNPDDMLTSLKVLLNEHLLAGKRVVVVLDDAQNLNESVLGLTQMLSSMETSQGKLVQFILCGQPRLLEREALPDAGQLRHRFTTVAHLEPFSPEDTALYLDHRLRTAGYERDAPLFSPGARALIAHYSEGIPRNINGLCFNSLTLGYKLKRKTIKSDIVRQVVSDLGLERWQSPPSFHIPEEAAEHDFADDKATTLPEKHASPRLPAPERYVAPSAPEAPSFPVAIASSLLSRVSPRFGLAAAAILAIAGSVFAIYHSGRSLPLSLPAQSPIKATSPVFPPAPAPVLNPVQPPIKAASPALGRTPVPVSHPTQPLTKAKSPAKRTAPVLSPATTPANAEHDLKGMDLAAAVKALSGRSANGICDINFGQCDSTQLQEIQKVNPRLDNRAAPAGSGGKPRTPVPQAPKSPRTRAHKAGASAQGG